MKIGSGVLKGRNFFMPKDIRPTQNMVREAVFNILGQDLSGMSFLDVFAGSGAIGLEAVSLGAKEVVFIEKEAKYCQVIRDNIVLLDPPTAGLVLQITVNQIDAFAAIKKFTAQNKRFDVVFIDPPYGRGQAKKALKTLGGYDILQPNCVVLIESKKSEVLPDRQDFLVLIKQKKYGSKMLSIYARAGCLNYLGGKNGANSNISRNI